MSKKILLVEDSRTEALRTQLILERAGYQITLAANGKEGLFKAAAEKPDAILLDTLMPQMGGFETCGRLKLDPQTTHIPVLILAAEDERANMPSGDALAFVLRKPFDPARLVNKLDEITNGNGTSGGDVHAELRHAKQQVEEAKKSRTDFLANMSHELRTPLHEIMGMTDLLLGTELTSEQQGFINTTRASSNALLSLISDVIEFSEIEAGQLSLEEKEFELAEPIERTLEIAMPYATDKGLDLSTSISAQLPKRLVGDANRVRQVLTNLVTNAIKFTERGGVVVTVKAEGGRMKDEKTQDPFILHSSSFILEFSVRDTGIGIPEDRREIIFEPFQQADSSATRRFGGMGMGLALAKQLVNLMGGKIWVDSQMGQGSTFHFTAQFKRAAVGPRPAVAALPSKPAQNLEILLAEDSPTNQLIAVANLKKAGHSVTVANNGRIAVQLFEERGQRGARSFFDLILMDVAMPEMDGLEATKAIREKEQSLGGHTPIIAMTAFTTKEYRDKCAAVGMDAYISKPVRIDELTKAFEPFLPRASEPPQASTVAPVALQDALEIVGGDVDLLKSAVALSLKEMTGQFEELKQALAQQNAKTVEAKAHRLKGIMGNLGAIAARDIAQRLETMGEQGNLAGGQAAAQELDSEIARVIAFFSDPGWETRARASQGGADG
ncbi:MAG: response regulator [Chloroflexota bacterium]